MPEMGLLRISGGLRRVDESVKHKPRSIMLSSNWTPPDIRRATDHKYVKSLSVNRFPTGLLDELMMSAGV